MLLQNTNEGLYCAAGNFHIDPWRPVDVAIITHAHSDHARPGSKRYVTESSGKEILQLRLGPAAPIETIGYGETVSHNGVKVSFHPAGHILGSAQVRLEYRGEISVVSGDYKLEKDGVSQAFEPIPCHHFVTESTFGLPIYHWRPQTEIFREIHQWWRDNQALGRTSVLFCYALGKAQRVLAGLDATVGPIFLHGAMERYLPAYQHAGVTFPPAAKPDAQSLKNAEGKGFVLAPGSADNSPWLRKFGEISTARASGWMQVRGTRRRASLDHGFVLSDHADWNGLRTTIQATGAEHIWVTHGYTQQFARWLRETGRDADVVETHFGEDAEEEPESA
jgi:putative mRNA 3-end processing factor